jgi:hypothetical protein
MNDKQSNIQTTDGVSEAELTIVASRIRPLPESIKPSDTFLKRTRARLVALVGPSDAAVRNAA